MPKLSPDLMRYLVWTAATVFGAVLAVVDRRMIGRRVFGFLLLAGVGAGLLLTVISPFSFGGTSYYMEGVILSGGSGLGFVGYLAALALQLVWERILKSGN